MGAGVEGWCFIAGMSAVLVCLPVLGLWGGNRRGSGRRRRDNSR